MMHKPNNRRAYLPIGHVGAQQGEEFLVILPIIEYRQSDFAREYNARKPKYLENTSLEWREEKFVMKVDSVEIELRGNELRAQEGKAVLDAKLNDEDKNTVKIAKGVDGFDFRLKEDHAVVTLMSENKEGVKMTYMRTRNDIPPHARLIEISHPGRSGLERWRHEFSMDREEVSLERAVDCKRDEIRVRFSEENTIRAASYWASHETHAKKWHQGDIGEEVAELVLEKSMFKTISEHTEPDEDRVPVHKSENHGMDRVIERDGKYYAVSAKHWLDLQKALHDARQDIEWASGRTSRAQTARIDKTGH
jgi:hypothetical protein